MTTNSSSIIGASKSIANITDHLLTEILIRLPDCRHAARCAAVCKRWSSLISHSHFIRAFVDHHASAAPLALLFQYHLYEYQKLPIIDSKFYQILFDKTLSYTNSYLSFLPYDDVVVRAYCDDLLLVSRANADYSGSFSFCICNPMSKKWCVLPEPPRGIVRLAKCALVCRRNNENQGHYCYNVALLFYITDGYLRRNANQVPETLRSTVFSSETAQWSPLAKFFPSPQMQRWRNILGRPWIFNEPVPCSNGVVHWLEGRRGNWEWIVTFDPLAAAAADDDRECGHICLPAEAGDNRWLARVRLGACKGRLRAAFVSHLEDGVIKLEVWERKDCDDNTASCCWSVVHNAVVEMEVHRGAFLMALHPNDGNLVFLLVDGINVCRYDMRLRKGEKVGQFPERVGAGIVLTVYALCSPWPTPVPSLQST